MNRSQFLALESAYIKAIHEHGEASAVVYHHVLNDTEPSVAEIQRKDDAHVILAATKATYLAAAELGQAKPK
jgi:hypothetical protein